ncbi:AAA family ATPase [Paenibacillus donghaensis]|uniref:AAA family ATPase n=1 Tax=Paenibacillus donghaensis TaxID=414771 RepID=UPI0018840939|nr:AAA family ATPase [Paenibacillus donghaensis]MBE9914725.1 AAA family ATPase [Paenibacillus donghaensis]
MIPWKMWFSGIRDYPATTMDLSGQMEHVLITGPNGAGKSTITYCMGAVLYSSKVIVEGLRSRNLSQDETWKAHIRLLFKNEGIDRLDAPEYIEFSLRIFQEPGQPVKKEFFISSGDDFENWEDTVRYTSGDRQYNFTAYKKDLQYKYKIDPDLFYLIWYQQEVNQFAVMHPEERFRIFAEMHGIDRAQQYWEESVEKLKETKETLRISESNVAHKKQWLKIKKTELDRYEDNRRRLLEGGKLYARTLLQLEDYYRREEEELKGLIEQLELDIDLEQDDMAEMAQRESAILDQIHMLAEQIESVKQELTRNEDILQKLTIEMKETETAVNELERELQHVSKEKERIRRTEDEVKQQLAEVKEQLWEAIHEKKIRECRLRECDQQKDLSLKLISKLEVEIEHDQQQEGIHKNRLLQYRSSHHIQEQLDQLDRSVAEAKDQRQNDLNEIRELKDELGRLEQAHDWSQRQMESLEFFRIKGVQAYTLSELVELDASVQLKWEERFNSIKYTIFFDGHAALPPNDLYHIPLRKVIPDRPVTELPDLRLRVKEGLEEKIIPHAMKALWWVAQFFTDGETRIEHGALIDPMGIRGPQEQRSRYILSARALLIRKETISKNIHDLTLKTEELSRMIERDTKKFHTLSSMIQLVRESEAFITLEHERTERIRKHEDENAKLDELLKHIHDLEQNRIFYHQEEVRLQHREHELQQEAGFYVKLGQLKGKYEDLHANKRVMESLREQMNAVNAHLEREEEKLDLLERRKKKQERALLDLQDQREVEERKLRQMNKQQEARKAQLSSVQQERIGKIREIEDLKQLIPDIYNDVIDAFGSDKKDSLSLERSIFELQQDLERGKIQFNFARQEQDIDPAAPENYKVVQEEYERLQNEYKRTKILFEEDQIRTDELKNALETTINMRVIEIRQRFTSYMSLFQFEGEIDWDSYEDRKQRTHFNLYIKARKEGHRGTLEDVSIKGRGGKVGKGVSGGEESLSSLLFALALLQNLQTAPGFIVLDEFDSALDEQRKLKVFDLYVQELKRKLIILTPKSHESSYLDRFFKAYIVHHDPTLPRSKVTGILRRDKII